jgi:hypothetical protein
MGEKTIKNKKIHRLPLSSHLPFFFCFPSLFCFCIPPGNISHSQTQTAKPPSSQTMKQARTIGNPTSKPKLKPKPKRPNYFQAKQARFTGAKSMGKEKMNSLQQTLDIS